MQTNERIVKDNPYVGLLSLGARPDQKASQPGFFQFNILVTNSLSACLVNVSKKVTRI